MIKYGIKSHSIDVSISKLEEFEICNKEFKTDPCFGKKKYLEVIINGKAFYYLENTIISLAKINNPPIGDFFKDITKKLVTFIIPSIGRSTLIYSLESIIQTESKLWNAIVVYDGIPIKDFGQPNISYISIPKIGYRNCAGEVRNHGIKLVETEWVAFLDDDDKITQDYMYRLESEIQSNPKADVIIFRMINSDGRVLPGQPHIACSNVGISFAVKTSVFHKQGFKFTPSSCEDFDLLTEFEKHKLQIHFSNFITYIVR